MIIGNHKMNRWIGKRHESLAFLYISTDRYLINNQSGLPLISLESPQRYRVSEDNPIHFESLKINNID